MLFNSYEFVFAFFPVTLAVFFLLRRVSRDFSLGWLIVASLFFYAWWRPENVFIIAPALLVNYLVARLLARVVVTERRSLAKVLLGVGIAFNLAFLGYFKYANFVVTAVNDVAGTNFALERIVLPLAISFITFQKIAFLIDVHGRRVEHFSFRDFCLFILFFPQLIAGPIVHFRETIPQFLEPSTRSKGEDISVGLTLFVFGFFKKIVLADGIATYVTPIYDAAGGGSMVSLFPAWIAAIGFTLQIYFDFSGYSDMAIGLARCFGIRLPLNFDSPLKARSIIDFWLRWHITLTRFLTAYVYNPIVLQLTRRRLAKGLPGYGKGRTGVGVFIELLAAPTLLTMFLSGLWHGAGYLFILWGLLHGAYIVINHAWRNFAQRRWSDQESYARIMGPLGWLLTFLSVVVAMVLFRSPTVDVALNVLQGMFGFGGITLPEQLLSQLGIVDLVSPWIGADAQSAGEFVTTAMWIVMLLFVALLMPNSHQMLSRFEPVLSDAYWRTGKLRSESIFAWTPSAGWLVALASIGVVSVLRLGGPSEFLYWQF